MTSSKPRIVFFATRLYSLATGQATGFGGAEAELWSVANQFGKDPRFDVRVFTLSPDASITDAQQIGSIQLHLARPSRPITYKNSWLERRRAIVEFFVRLFFSARRQKGDVYFTKLASSEATTIWLASRFNRAKYVFRIEHDWETNPHDLVNKVFRGSGFWAKVFLFCLKRADMVIVQTDKQREALQRNYGIRSILIPNAHHIPSDQAIVTDPEKRPYVLWVGRCHPMKRPEVFLDLARQNPHLSFLMIMPPNSEHQGLFDSCARQAEALPNLELVPGVNTANMDGYYQKARVLALTSDAEGFSNVVIEAMKNGAPAITWDHNPNNILIDVADPKAFHPAPGYCIDNRIDLASQVISRLYDEPELWSACQTDARRIAKECFGIETIVDLYAERIERLLGQKMNTVVEKFAKTINRQRIKPSLFDYAYLNLRGNYKTMREFAAMVSPTARVLDAGCGFKPWEACFPGTVEYRGIDYNGEWAAPDAFASADALPFADNTFDAVICSEVLEHARYPERCITELKRVCKPDGLLYISTPFCFPEHGVPYDFQRLTQYFYKDVFKNDEIVALHSSSSTMGTAFTTFNFFVECTPLRMVWGFRHIVYFVCNILGLISDALINYFAPKIMRTLKLYTHMLSLGYSMIIKVRKSG